MYYILEIQKTDDETVAQILHTATTRNEAESTYHSVLASAAISNVPWHSAIIISDLAAPVAFSTYTHPQEATE